MKIFWVGCLSLSLTSYAQSQNVQRKSSEILNAIEKSTTTSLTKLTSNGRNCASTNDYSNIKLMAEPSANVLNLLSKTSCNDLLSETPPKKFQDEYAVSKKKVWFPICSYLSSIYQNDNQGESFGKVLKETLELDSCAVNESSSRYSASYKAPSQNERSLIPFDSNEQIIFKNDVLKIKESVKNTCCNNNKTCEDIFNQVKISYCKHQSDPRKSDSCTDFGAYYNSNPSKEFINTLIKIENQNDFKNKMPNLIAGEITLNLLKSSSDGTANAESSVIAHEFGHACSFIIAELNAKSGDKSAINWLVDDVFDDKTQSKDEKCTLTQDTSSDYLEKFSSVGYSEDTFQCIVDNSKNATKKRFSTGKCLGGCPRSYIEEFMANAYAYSSMKNDLGDMIIGRNCFTYRDQEHPLSYDEIKCIMKTDSIKNRFMKDVKCIK